MQTKKFIARIVGNAFFTVYFRKADGSMRKLTGRLGVTKGLRGTGARKQRNVVTVWDCAKSEYRSFDPARVQWVKCWGVTINF